ncbi:hypothetical protein TSAR_000615 [Trichomalopsis sarcophagae]|uniref:Uncharacterized protein n=1 Tax=Trichomalopsis sarcophagae TaxID=543379 RepID=A0A232FAB9_9HYME|nr:hypothetical protein TSAR_000615 [Trichomalopsis sarcophagae]
MTSVSSHGFHRTGFLMRKMASYMPNEVVDILIILDECIRNYRLLPVLMWSDFQITAILMLDKRALKTLDLNPNFFWEVCFSDEATFISNGSLNRHNCHYWSPENPHWYPSMYGLAFVINGQVIGHYFFERTINGPMYLEFLENDFKIPRECST